MFERKCVLVDNKNSLTSNILPSPTSGKTYYDVIMDLVSGGNYRNYFDDGDYIELTTTNGDLFHMIMNINTYKNYGDGGNRVGNHIDLISECIIPNSDKGNYQMRTENKNNGTSSIKTPFLASSNMVSKLNAYSAYLPATLKAHAVNKRFLTPTRYSASNANLTEDNSWEWNYYGPTTGKLWLPHEIEVYGYNVWATKGWAAGGARLYKSFEKFPELRIKYASQGSDSRAAWWLADATAGDSTAFCAANDYGYTYASGASFTNFGVPLCIRIQ